MAPGRTTRLTLAIKGPVPASWDVIAAVRRATTLGRAVAGNGEVQCDPLVDVDRRDCRRFLIGPGHVDPRARLKVAIAHTELHQGQGWIVRRGWHDVAGERDDICQLVHRDGSHVEVERQRRRVEHEQIVDPAIFVELEVHRSGVPQRRHRQLHAPTLVGVATGQLREALGIGHRADANVHAGVDVGPPLRGRRDRDRGRNGIRDLPGHTPETVPGSAGIGAGSLQTILKMRLLLIDGIPLVRAGEPAGRIARSAGLNARLGFAGTRRHTAGPPCSRTFSCTPRTPSPGSAARTPGRWQSALLASATWRPSIPTICRHPVKSRNAPNEKAPISLAIRIVSAGAR